MGYFDMEIKTTVIFAILGIVVGYASFLINNSVQSFLLMIVIALAFVFILKKTLKINENSKWWFSNGLPIYILLWFITWIILYNVGLR